MPTPLKRLAERIHQRIDRVERHRPEWRKGQVTSVDPLRVDGVRAGNVSGRALGVDTVVWMQVGHGRRQVAGVIGEATPLSVTQFGAKGDGSTDDTSAIQAAIDAAATVVESYKNVGDVHTARIIVPSGRYRTTAPLVYYDGMQICGDGSASTFIDVDHSGNGVDADDDTTERANVRLCGFSIRDIGGTSPSGLRLSQLIRNCTVNDVVAHDFQDNFHAVGSQTLALVDCAGYHARRHSVLWDSGGGELFIVRNRHDVAGDHLIEFDAAAGELIVVDTAAQFGDEACVNMTSGRSVYLGNCFFEGACIGSSTSYYVQLQGAGASQRTTATVHGCIMNDKADSNRTGLGVFFADGFRHVDYRERWVRNAVQEVPEMGSDVRSLRARIGEAGDLTPAYTHIDGSAGRIADIIQNDQPRKFRGNVEFGGDDARFSESNSEFMGRFRSVTRLVGSNVTPESDIGYVGCDTSGNIVNVNLDNIAHDPGREITVGKVSDDANNLHINPGTGQVDGGSSLTLSGAREHVRLVSNGTDWFIAGRS